MRGNISYLISCLLSWIIKYSSALYKTTRTVQILTIACRVRNVSILGTYKFEGSYKSSPYAWYLYCLSLLHPIWQHFHCISVKTPHVSLGAVKYINLKHVDSLSNNRRETSAKNIINHPILPYPSNFRFIPPELYYHN